MHSIWRPTDTGYEAEYRGGDSPNAIRFGRGKEPEWTTILSSKPVPGGIKVNQTYRMSLSVKSASLFATVTRGGGAMTNLSVTDNVLGRGLAGLFGSYGCGGFSNVQIQSQAWTIKCSWLPWMHSIEILPCTHHLSTFFLFLDRAFYYAGFYSFI